MKTIYPSKVDVTSNHGTYGIAFLVYHFQLHDHSSILDHCHIVDIIPVPDQDQWIVYPVQDHFRDEKGHALVRRSDLLKIRYQARADQLLLGFTGAFQRGELTALNIGDLVFDEEGILIDIRRSKTDQLGQGQLKAIFYASHL